VVDVINPDGIANARIVADDSVAHHRELLKAAREAGGLALDDSALQASLLATIERERSSQELNETLSRLLPTGLADRLRHDGLRIGQPEMVEVTLLMSDVRGYPGIAETTDPAEVAGQINEHGRAMNHVIMNHAGIVMQYVGDAVFAVFGPTTLAGQHTDQAFAPPKKCTASNTTSTEHGPTAAYPFSKWASAYPPGGSRRAARLSCAL
jgi:class 3 adenylate cyclase